jgi:hypothetical protein
MIVGERTLRNKIPETQKSAALVPSARIAVVRSRKFTPARRGMLTPLLSGSTKGEQASESVQSSLWPQTDPKAAKQPGDYRGAPPGIGAGQNQPQPKGTLKSSQIKVAL